MTDGQRFVVHHGDNMAILPTLADCSVDAIVTDPPYSLTDRRKKNCASDVIRDAIVRDAKHPEPQRGQGLVTFSIKVSPAFAVSILGINLDDEAALGQVEVNRDRSVRGQQHDVLMDEGNPVQGQQVPGGDFRLWVREGRAACIGACRCLRKDADGLLRVPVWLTDDALREPKGSAGVVTLARTELAAVLTLDLGGRSGELLPASGADAVDPVFELLCPQGVGALARASRLPAVAKPGHVGEIGGGADAAFTFNLLSHPVALSWRPITQKGFMSIVWDGTGIETDVRLWREALRVIKPGGHLLAFGGSRTYHRTACAIEDAGFEIVDQIMWVHGQGFPKSKNGKWGGTALKPSHEPIVLARKPLRGNVAQNVLAHGTGALNIDACRINGADALDGRSRHGGGLMQGSSFQMPDSVSSMPAGRWPANLIHSGEPEVLAAFPQTTTNSGVIRKPGGLGNIQFAPSRQVGTVVSNGDTGSAARFFMRCPPDDGSLFPDDANPPNPRGGGFRDEGAIKGNVDFKQGSRATLPVIRDDTGGPASYFMQCPPDEATRLYYTPKASRSDRDKGNTHSTVKPISLMRYLCRLITPPDGLVLDVFCGSGSTGQAAMFEGFRFIGIEQDAGHVELARHRIGLAARNGWQPELELEIAA